MKKVLHGARFGSGVCSSNFRKRQAVPAACAVQRSEENSMQRLRRTRGSQLLRDLVAETAVRAEKLIWPLFVRWGENVKEESPSMPGGYR